MAGIWNNKSFGLNLLSSLQLPYQMQIMLPNNIKYILEARVWDYDKYTWSRDPNLAVKTTHFQKQLQYIL